MRLFYLAIALALAFFSASPAVAQQVIAEYYALIGPEDMRNSSGVRIGDFCAIVSQDRANYHRFGIRHEGDMSDPIFHDPEMRARIAGRCRAVAGSEYIPGTLLRGETRFIWVRVYGQGDVLTEVLVSEGAG